MDFLDPIYWAVILLIIGCGFAAAEVFFPSGGVLGCLATASILAALVVAYRHHGPKATAGFAGLAIVLVPTTLALAIKYWPRTPLGRRFIGELPTAEEVIPDDRSHRLKALVGEQGVAHTPLLPSGAVNIGGKVIDAVSQGEVIEQGERVRVLEVRAYRVVVRRLTDGESGPKDRPEDDPLQKSLDELGIEPLDDLLA